MMRKDLLKLLLARRQSGGGDPTAGYRRVEYLESPSTAYPYIDTGVYLNQDSDFEVDYQYTTYANTYSAFGVNPLMVLTTSNSGTTSFRYNNGTYAYPQAPTVRAIRGFKKNEGYVDGVSVWTFTAATFTTAYSALLFARRVNSNGSVTEPARMKCWSCKIRDAQGNLIRDFVPCVRIADNKPGMYDLCESVCPLTGTPLYINARGSGGDFIWGELQ